jgi:hypothetical protein
MIKVTELIHNVKQSLLNSTTSTTITTTTTTTLRLHDPDLSVCLKAFKKMHRKVFQIVHGEEGDDEGPSINVIKYGL